MSVTPTAVRFVNPMLSSLLPRYSSVGKLAHIACRNIATCQDYTRLGNIPGKRKTSDADTKSRDNLAGFDRFIGTWDEKKKKNTTAFLQAMGISDKKEIERYKNTNTWIAFQKIRDEFVVEVGFIGTFFSNEIFFKFGEEVTVPLKEGPAVKVLYTMDGDTFKEKHERAVSSKIYFLYITREVQGNKLKSVSTVNGVSMTTTHKLRKEVH